MQSPENYPQGGDVQRPNWPWLVNGAICFAAFALFLFIYICHSVTPVQVLAGVFLLPALAKVLIGPLVELAIGRRHGIRMTAVQAGPLCWTREEGRMRFHSRSPSASDAPSHRPTGRSWKVRTSQCCTG